MKKTTWLNEWDGGLLEPAVGYATYGNEPDTNAQYSAAVLFIRIPPTTERGKQQGIAPSSTFEGIAADEPPKRSEPESKSNTN